MSATALREQAQAIADAAPEVDAPKALAAALVAALVDLTIVNTGRKVTVKTKDGGNYSYDYADLGDVVKLTRPVLAQHGLVALTPVHDHGQGLACTVTILHESGERLDLGPFPFPHGRDAQATGSMVTYHRRYALVAALGMAAGDDDDGAAAKPREPEPVAWNKNMVKQHLQARLGTVAKAGEAWKLGHGDDLTEWSQEIADRLADEWLANQPQDEEVQP